MAMKNFVTRFSVDGKSGYECSVKAPSPSSAMRIAKTEIEGKAGFVGRKIRIQSAREDK